MSDISKTGEGVPFQSRPGDVTRLAQGPAVQSSESVKPALSVGAAGAGGSSGSQGKDGRSAGDNPLSDPLERAAQALEKFIPAQEDEPKTKLRIEKDEESGRFIYQNVNTETGEVVRQFPPEDILEFLSFFRNPEGVAFDDKA
ncbi:flagellar protein FlaG [Yunchengibacter salinarum]|uniref:flagellar protein FlaG n=1 Tax=Yunchengibacter salinarum TaxID=3133399 RepID=UPI0035B67C50